MGVQEGKQAPFEKCWRVWEEISENLYVMYKHERGRFMFAPLYIHSFAFARPTKLTDAQRFMKQYSDPSKVDSIADKLRWYRYQKALLQRDVADAVGLERSTYINYEDSNRDYYPITYLERLAGLYGIKVTELLDDYHRFLYTGQSKEIKKVRKRLGITQGELAERLNVATGVVKKWEQERVRMTKSTWEKLQQI